MAMIPLSYFISRGVRFVYETQPRDIPTVYGPLSNTQLRAELTKAVDERRGLPKQSKRHEGECDKLGRKGTETFCKRCRMARGICIFCSSAGLPAGDLDCPLCRLAGVKLLRERGAKI
jgi:hypothetical protein